MDPRKIVVSQLLDGRAPILLVQSSPGAEAVALKNGLTVADLIRPFAEVKEGTPFRTGQTSFALRGQKLRVIHAAELACPAWDSTEAALNRVAAAEATTAGVPSPGAPSPAKASSTLPELSLSSGEDASRWVSKLKGGDATPWATGYRRALSTTLRCLPVDQTDCPAAVLCVISTSDPDPVRALQELMSSSALPRPYGSDQYDPTSSSEGSVSGAPRVVVLLSDKSAEKETALTARNIAAAAEAGAADASSAASAGGPPFTSALHGSKPCDPNALLRELKPRLGNVQSFGAYINSAAPSEVYAGSAAVAVDVWSAGISEPLSSRPVGVPVLYASPQGPGGALAITAGAGAGAGAVTAAPSTPVKQAPGNRSSGPATVLSLSETMLQCALVPRRGCCLTDSDVTGLRSMFRQIIDTIVVPSIEARVYALANMAGKQRAGLRGKIMSFMGSAPTGLTSGFAGPGTRTGTVVVAGSTGGGGNAVGLGLTGSTQSATALLAGPSSSAASTSAGSTTGVGTGPGQYTSLTGAGSGSGFDDGPAGSSPALSADVITVTFPYATPWAQSRLLADLMLFAGDAEGAGSLYKQLRDDAKGEKAAAHYAAACEGLALSYLLRDVKENPGSYSSVNREAEGALETAANGYYRAAQAAAAAIPSGAAQFGGAVGGMGSPMPLTAPGPAGYVSVGIATSGLGAPTASPAQPPVVDQTALAAVTTAQVARRVALRLATRAAFALCELQIGTSVALLQSLTGSSKDLTEKSGAAAAPAIASANSRIKEAAALLRRMAQAEGDGTLAAALLTECAGVACLRMSPVSHRRAAYHLATAGMLYGAAGPQFAGLAVRCLLAASTAVGDNPAAQLKPVTGSSYLLSNGSGGPTDAAMPWGLISDHLCLHAAQRLLQLGNAEGAANALCAALTTSAVRLPPVAQRNMIRELVRAHSIAQAGKRASHAKAAAERWAKKEKATLPAAVALLDGSSSLASASGSGTLPDLDAITTQQAATYDALAQAVPETVLQGILADADKASEVVSPGLPIVDDHSVQIVSWSNALAAAHAVGQVCAAAGPALGGAGGRAGGDASATSPPMVCFKGTGRAPAGYPLWSTDPSALTSHSQALLDLGTAEGCVPGEGLWAGHLPGEGPVRLGESPSGPGRPAWVRMLESWTRDWKAREKAGGQPLFVTSADGQDASSSGRIMMVPVTPMTPSSTPTAATPNASGGGGAGPQGSPVAGPFDWRKVCTDIAIAAEDESEMATKAHKGSRAAALGQVHAGSSGVDGSGAGTAFTGAASLAPYMTEGSDGSSTTTWPESTSSSTVAVDTDDLGLSPVDGGLDNIDEGAEVSPCGPGAAALLATAAAMARPAGAAAAGGPPLAPGRAGPPVSGGASGPSSAPSNTSLTGASQTTLYHAAEVVSKAGERYAGEPVGVLVRLINPTGVELTLSGLRLVGEVKDVKPEAGVLSLADVHASAGPGWTVETGKAAGTASGAVYLATMSVDVTLGPSETRTVYLLATPLASGTMVVKGLSWRLLAGPQGNANGVSTGLGPRYRHDFDLKGPPLNDSKANKASGARAVDRRLEAKVKPPREWAGARLDGLVPEWAAGMGSTSDTVSVMAPVPSAPAYTLDGPGAMSGPPIPAGPPLPVHLPVARTATMWEGEVRPVTLSFTNAGSQPISSIWVRGTGGGKMIVASADGRLDGLEGATLRLDLATATITDGALVQVPVLPGTAGDASVAALPPGATVSWTLHVRAAKVGLHALRLLILYSSQTTGGITGRSLAAGAVRTLRWCARVRVLPSLASLAVVRPSAHEAGLFDLTVHVANTSPPSAGGKLPTQGVANAAPVSLPVHVPEVRLISSEWRAELTAVGTRSMVAQPGAAAAATGAAALVTSDQGPANLSAACAAPLPYLSVRTFRYRLVPSMPHPTSIVLPSGEVIVLDGAAAAAETPAAGGVEVQAAVPAPAPAPAPAPPPAPGMGADDLESLFFGGAAGAGAAGATSPSAGSAATPTAVPDEPSEETGGKKDKKDKKDKKEKKDKKDKKDKKSKSEKAEPEDEPETPAAAPVPAPAPAPVAVAAPTTAPQPAIRAPTPASTAAVAPSLSTLSAPGGSDDLVGRLNLAGVSPAFLSLLRSGHGQDTVASLVAHARQTEHARRRAAEAADALPPTLRSIRMAKAGGEGGDGTGADAGIVTDPLPSSLAALEGQADGRPVLGVLVSWVRPASVLAAVTGGARSRAGSLAAGATAGTAAVASGSSTDASVGFLYLSDLVLARRASSSAAGSAVSSLLAQLAAAAAVAQQQQAADGSKATAVVAPAVPAAVAQGPFGPGPGLARQPSSADITAPSTPLAARRPSAPGAGAAAGPAVTAARRPSLSSPLPGDVLKAIAGSPLVASLSLAVDDDGTGSGSDATSGAGRVVSAVATLSLYHVGYASGSRDGAAAGASGDEGAPVGPVSLQLALLSGSDAASSGLPSWLVAETSVGRAVSWTGPGVRNLPVLRPGQRLVVPLTLQVRTGDGLARLREEAVSSLAVRAVGGDATGPWMPLAL